MTEEAKKVWQVMENDFGWSNQPQDFHLEYFEDIIKATKQALTIPDVVGQSEELCDHPIDKRASFKSHGKDFCWKCGNHIEA